MENIYIYSTTSNKLITNKMSLAILKIFIKKKSKSWKMKVVLTTHHKVIIMDMPFNYEKEKAT